MNARGALLRLALVGGFAFLYLPLLALMIYSFNASKLVTVWAGFSTQWYVALVNDAQIADAARMSLMVAGVNATLATVLGTLAALALVRGGNFRTRTLFTALTAAPLVMPEVIVGISLLLLFVMLEQWIGWPRGRGFTTIVIAHVTFSLAYVTVIVRARLLGIDAALIDAALDLGARPWAAFLRVTLPLLAPALGAGWLLAFTLSLDDLVIASFVSGPGATTLPMLIYSRVRLGLSPEINALATVLVVTVAVGLGGTAWLLARPRAEST